MSRRSDSELKPRNGHVLKVAIVARISGRPSQKEASLEDQQDNARETIADLYDGMVDFDVIASSKAKGERLDRPELANIEDAYKSGLYDVFVYDDLGRLIRGGEAVRLLGIGVDLGTRSICINDGVDTANETWEEDALTACSENVAHCERTSRRIKQKCMNRFKRNGQVARRPITGYIVPPEAKCYGDWQKDEMLAETIREGAGRLRQHLNCSTVADWFNGVGFPLGAHARSEKWTGQKVRSYYSNPILKGFPQRGKMHSVKHHGSGRRRSVKNPKGSTYYEAPHLAHMTIEEFDELNDALREHNADYRRGRNNGTDPRRGLPRKRTRYPGQLARCWYCGHIDVWGGNGITDNLMCSAARDWHCWNSTGFSGELAATKTVEAIVAELRQLDGVREQFAELVKFAMHKTVGDPDNRMAALRRDQSRLEDKRGKAMAAILEYGPRPDIKAELDAIDAKEMEIAKEQSALERLQQRRLVLPESPTALHERFEANFKKLAIDSPEFGDLLRPLVPQFHVYLVRLVDGGQLLPRAILELNLAGDFPDVAKVPDLHRLVTRRIVLDLFEPPVRERIRLQTASMTAETPRPTAREIARRLPTSERAVSEALKLHERMLGLGLSDPYTVVLEPPQDIAKFRRHKNPRYSFKAAVGYERPALQ